MTAIRFSAEQERLWSAILAKKEELKQAHPHRGYTSTVALLTLDGQIVSSHLHLHLADGSASVFYIEAWERWGKVELQVSRWVDNHDDLWEARAADSTDAVIIDSEFYRIRREPTVRELTEHRSDFGHGGQRFVIRFHDGREVVTHNLWHGGTVPPAFRDRLPDTAEFVREPSAVPA